MKHTAPKPIIEFKDVSLKFGQKQIFDHFDFSVMPQDKVVVYGKSGTGKSTLLKLILGFTQPDSGKIILKNKQINPKNIDWIRTQIAYVDQDTLIGYGKVSNLIDEYFTFQANKHLSLKQTEIAKHMADFDLDQKLLSQDVEELSGGERQRLALVIALLLKRPLMVLDEVTASLDPASKRLAIRNLLKQKDITLLVVTHDKEWKNSSQTKLFDFKEKQWIQ